MADRLSDTRMEAYSQFKNWLDVQPCWLQDATYRIYHGLPIDDKQIQAYVDMCVAENKKEKPVYKHIDDKDIEATRSINKIAVLSLSNIIGVNALSSDAKLDFSPDGVTVVYGLNGAGKSGFMRIFKQVSGSPFEEPIQPNVFTKTATGKPSCTFLIRVDDQEQSIICNLATKTKDSFLAGCDVFDTRISNAYISNSNSPSYQPFVFTVLTELSTVADAINSRMREMVNSITPTRINFPEALCFQDDTRWVQTLSAETIIPNQFAEWTEEQNKRLNELPLLLDTQNVVQRLQLLQTQLQVLSPILKDIKAAKDILISGKIKELFNQYQKAKARLDAAKRLFADSSDDMDKISLSSNDWKLLWGAAKRYYETFIFSKDCKHFGEEGSVCPLCHQKIIGSTATRIQNVDEYVNGTCSQDSNTAYRELQSAISSLCNRRYIQEQVRSALVDIIDKEQIEKICEVYGALAAISANNDIEQKYSLSCAIDVNEVIDMLSQKAETLDNEIKTLDSAMKAEERVSMQNELAHLQCCKWIYDSNVAIQESINMLKRKKELADAMSLLSTNKITFETNRLAESLITAAYIERFNAELRRLAPNIKVKLEKAASRKGNSPYRVILDSVIGSNTKTEDILSEGEQRIVALAAFFADATGRNVNTPLIIDDPISSLDINYESVATQRIVELARNRQVIVFTHRISMLTGIEEVCQRLGINHRENYIRSTLKGKGAPDFADVYRGDVKKHLTGIQQRITEIKKLDQDSPDYLDAIGKQCQQFRICVERSVEDILLQGMVRRFDRRIMTNGKLTKLTRVTDDDCKFVDSMMTKYSFTEHSQPADSPPIEIDIDELNEDIVTYIKWISDYRKRMQ